mmetsp:Transcript_16570/g.38086  ORF Transcript_16570/g.38086 Transcript_16570/m.38086 type:complete len:255 (+) Transcript_16570:30-794(+)
MKTYECVRDSLLVNLVMHRRRVDNPHSGMEILLWRQCFGMEITTTSETVSRIPVLFLLQNCSNDVDCQGSLKSGRFGVFVCRQGNIHEASVDSAQSIGIECCSSERTIAYRLNPFEWFPTQSTRSPAIIKCRCRRWAISSLTEFKDALAPCMSNQIVGCNPPSPSIRSISMLPPATVKNGRTPSRTTLICSSSRGGPSGMAWITSWISGIFSFNPRSRPIFMVCVEEGQVPHAPCNSNRTTGPSISVIATFPPS